MKPSSNHDLPVFAFNVEVKRIYFKLIKEAKALLATVPDEPMRYTLTREEKHKITRQFILHEFVNPLLYLRLELYPNDQLGIHYGYEVLPVFSPYYPIVTAFVRTIYKHTMADNTSMNIENAVRLDWIIENCSDAYEYLEENGLKHHSFALIPYKPKQTKRKLRKVA